MQQGYLMFSGAGEQDRLSPLEEMYDVGTINYFRMLGVDTGWHCLEIGAGAGSITDWLCQRVGPTGHVLATDIDVSLVKEVRHANLEIQVHDITYQPLVENTFDLVHARLLLEHLPNREEVLSKMVKALKPGGWILVEDMDWDVLHPVSDAGADIFRRTASVMRMLFATGGYDPTFGCQLPLMLQKQGLVEMDNEVRGRIILGGSERANAFFTRSIQQLAGPFRGLSLLTDEEIEQALSWGEDSKNAGIPAMLVAAWGRRPPEV